MRKNHSKKEKQRHENTKHESHFQPHLFPWWQENETTTGRSQNHFIQEPNKPRLHGEKNTQRQTQDYSDTFYGDSSSTTSKGNKKIGISFQYFLLILFVLQKF
ncbi:UNVERIFIED_CONTAM: hypothetical protein RMT77_019347 [Armadillidium vulgare]